MDKSLEDKVSAHLGDKVDGPMTKALAGRTFSYKYTSGIGYRVSFDEEKVYFRATIPGLKALVIGKTGKNIPKDKALTHVAGYIVCNDVSARDWQRDPGKAGLAPQWCFSKGFDKWLPVGPMLVSPSVVGNAGSLQLRTLVNGEIRQDASTDDLLFGVEEIVSFCSQGTTLEAGTLILTGTPSGVAMGMKPPRYLQNGDIVEVSISGLGSVRNKMVFE
ncbi:hypothetical protein SBRCBS47491_004268 [Sporothrix bragantina]|uniref:Fumarylacetoacetase-like C-terminal domain-containing protein n=1 Tax=Sporothrix bragantina TaxID=671064 RepID=A0ABP0BNH6_9PEZI